MITLATLSIIIGALLTGKKQRINVFEIINLPLIKSIKNLSWIIIYLFFFIILLNDQKVKAQTCSNLNLSFITSLNNNGCLNPDTIKLTNTSSGTNVASTTFYWSVNGVCFDTTSGSSSPKILIKNQGNYKITLTGITVSSCIDSISQTVTIFQAAKPDFSILCDTICLNNRAFFTNLSSGTNSNSSYSWTFGNSVTSSNKDTVSVKYTSTGVYNVCLKIQQNNCIYTKTQTISVINGKLPIKFYNNLGIALESVSWKRCLSLVTDPDSFSQSFASPDTLVNYTIIFGDGSSVKGSQLLPYPNGIIKHTYLKTGVFDFYVISRETNGCERIFSGKVINLRYPVVGIGGPDNGHTNGCVPFTTPFKNTSTHVSGCTEFTWDFGDGDVKKYDYKNQGDSVYHTYLKSKCNIFIKLKATNSCGTTETTWGPVNAYDIDTAKISSDKNIVCYPNTTVNFQNLTKYNCYSETRNFFWDFGDGSNSGWTTIGAGTSHKYNSPGVYMVKFKDSNLCGVDTYSVKITVYGPLQAGFKYSPASIGCKKYTVSFTDTSKGDNISSYKWYFGDGDSSSLKNPIHTFNDTGSFKVKLVITASCGTSEFSSQIKVYKKPVAEIADINDQCLPAKISYNNKSKDYSPFASYYWDFGDSTFSTAFKPADKNFSSPGIYTVKLKIKDTCGIDSTTRTFKVYNQPKVSFVATISEICQYKKALFNNTTSFSDSLIWDFGDKTPLYYSENIPGTNHTYNTHGTFYVKLTALNSIGCSHKDSVKVTVNPAPVADFSSPLYSGCVPMTVSFNNKSSYSDTFYWYINGVLKSTNSTLSAQTFSNPNDSISVMLITKNKFNCLADTVVKQYFTYKNPQPSFSKSVTKGCGPLSVSFTNKSQNANQFIWYFGDGDTSTKINPVHTYQPSQYKDTFYVICMKAYSAISCIDSIFDTVYVYPLPLIEFSISKSAGCGPLSTSFTNMSSPRDTGSISIMSFVWNLGNNKSATTTNSAAIYNSSKTKDSIYYIKLTGITEHGCKDSLVKTIKVYANPAISFSTDSKEGCNPLQVKFTNTSKPNDSSSISAMSFLWNFGNGNCSTQTNPVQTFTNTKTGDSTYYIKLVGYNSHSCIDSFSSTIKVHSDPVSSFSVNKSAGCSPLSVAFTNSSTPNDTGTLASMSYVWHFGDNTTSGAIHPTKVFSSSNTTTSIYQVKLITTTIHGCSDTSTTNITVHPLPTVDFQPSATQTCNPAMITFTNYSKPNDTGSFLSDLTYSWNFGDGITSAAKSFAKSYSASDFKDTVYKVKLIVTSKQGCTDSLIKSIAIFPKPAVTFITDKQNGCGPLSVSFTNKSNPKDTGNIKMMSFIWNFGNGSFSTEQDKKITFNSSEYSDTVYTVKLVGISEHGCKDSFTNQVKVYPKPLASFNVSENKGCGPLSVIFYNKSTNYKGASTNTGNLNYSWNFGNGLKSTCKDTQITYYSSSLQDTTYTISLTTTSSNGCSAAFSGNITVYPTPTINFTPNISKGCGPLNITFSNLSNPNGSGNINNMTFKWDLGTGKTSSSVSASETFMASLTKDTIYKIKLVGKTVNGCSDSISKSITVYPKPTVKFSNSKTNGCSPLEVKFNNLSNPNDTGSIYIMNFI